MASWSWLLVLVGMLVGGGTIYVVHEHPGATGPIGTAAVVLTMLVAVAAIVGSRS